ncbi:phenylalanine 4-monooxygenase [Cucumibacter marinus]|uniref:phenylalanine 4-monooxygenase n=1 Tax=Cucumibacter marinus TaxID=1121252 RepID=UPI0004066A23|nr:phenylalanine 4-monooxygenase [Cucumibacter marinus]
MQEIQTSKNRYAEVPKHADYTIDQQWETYSAEEHDRWDRLMARQKAILPGRACDEYIKAVDTLELSEGGIPDFEKLSAKLKKLTGWEVVAVADLVPGEYFFEHLANRRFPAGAFIRPESEMDYLEEPDIFHDVFGHVPLLSDPRFADFMQAYGAQGVEARRRGALPNLGKYYWFTAEFGLINTPEGRRIYGAGILSSMGETQFALENPSPNHLKFDIRRVMRQDYFIDDYQPTYFVINDFDELLDFAHKDFGPIYDDVAGKPFYDIGEVLDTDHVYQRGTLDYFKRKGKL